MFVLTNQILGNSRIKQKEAACKYMFNEYHRLAIDTSLPLVNDKWKTCQGYMKSVMSKTHCCHA
jgi:hypothetical protein